MRSWTRTVSEETLAMWRMLTRKYSADWESTDFFTYNAWVMLHPGVAFFLPFVLKWQRIVYSRNLTKLSTKRSREYTNKNMEESPYDQ